MRKSCGPIATPKLYSHIILAAGRHANSFTCVAMLLTLNVEAILSVIANYLLVLALR